MGIYPSAKIRKKHNIRQFGVMFFSNLEQNYSNVWLFFENSVNWACKVDALQCNSVAVSLMLLVVFDGYTHMSIHIKFAFAFVIL